MAVPGATNKAFTTFVSYIPISLDRVRIDQITQKKIFYHEGLTIDRILSAIDGHIVPHSCAISNTTANILQGKIDYPTILVDKNGGFALIAGIYFMFIENDLDSAIQWFNHTVVMNPSYHAIAYTLISHAYYTCHDYLNMNKYIKIVVETCKVYINVHILMLFALDQNNLDDYEKYFTLFINKVKCTVPEFTNAILVVKRKMNPVRQYKLLMTIKSDFANTQEAINKEITTLRNTREVSFYINAKLFSEKYNTRSPECSICLLENQLEIMLPDGCSICDECYSKITIDNCPKCGRSLGL